jgi:hypothetical protein
LEPNHGPKKQRPRAPAQGRRAGRGAKRFRRPIRPRAWSCADRSPCRPLSTGRAF